MSADCETWYRVPRSAEECAVHLEAGGVVEVSERMDGCWRLAASDAEAKVATAIREALEAQR